MTTQFSHDIRVLTCQSCGAPIDAALTGGPLECSYCGTTHYVTERDERPDRERARLGLGAPISESERHAQLRVQQSSEQELPQSLRAWLQADGSLSPAFTQHAARDWQEARQQLSAGSKAFNVAERLFYLTLLLAPQLDPRRSRAMLETAAELLSDERHRHVVRCMLARLAAQHADVAAAEAWLQTCNPRPTDLTMDTAYRHAAATIAVVQRDFARVGELLGSREGDVPLAARDALPCELLRVHALEQGSDLERACTELDRLALAHGEEGLQRQLEAHKPLALCPRSYPERQRRISLRRDRALLAEAVEKRTRVRTGVMAVADLVSNMPFIALALVILIAPIRCISDSDPLLGVYGLPLCPQVCDGCYGPTRTVTAWSHSSRGHSTDGARYFCNSASTRVDGLDDYRLAEAAGKLTQQELGFPAAAGGTYLTLLGLQLLLLPLTGLNRQRKSTASAQALDREIVALCQRLGQEPPELGQATGLRAIARELRFFALSVAVALAAIAISLATA